MSDPANLPYGLPPYVIEQLREVFREWPQILRVTLYGSRAKGNYRNGSDIDLSVEAPELGIGDLLRLDGQIDDLLLPWKVEIALRHQIDNPDLLAHIDRVGVPIYTSPRRQRAQKRGSPPVGGASRGDL